MGLLDVESNDKKRLELLKFRTMLTEILRIDPEFKHCIIFIQVNDN